MVVKNILNIMVGRRKIYVAVCAWVPTSGREIRMKHSLIASCLAMIIVEFRLLNRDFSHALLSLFI